MSSLKWLSVMLVVLIVVCFPVAVMADESQNMPFGYIYRYYTSVMGVQEPRSEAVIFDERRGVYVVVSFLGDMYYNSLGANGFIQFTDFASCEFRVYECTGRSLFSTSDAQNFSFNVPAQNVSIRPATPTGTIRVSGTSTHGSHGATTSFRYTYDSSRGWYLNEATTIDNLYTETHNEVITMTWPQYNATFGAYVSQGVLNACTSGYVDYYLLQKAGSGVSTSMDYKATIDQRDSIWGYPTGGLFWSDGNYLIGNVVALYNVDSLYYGRNYIARVAATGVGLGHWTAVASNFDRTRFYPAAGTREYSSLTLPVVNKFLRHFGYMEIYYSESGNQLSNDLGMIGDSMQGAADAAGGFQGAADAALNDVTQYAAQTSSVFNRVWSIFPAWLWICITAGLVIVVGRKIMGR